MIADPQVADAAVIGVPDAVYGEAVVAFIEPKRGESPTPKSVVDRVRGLIAGYKKPKYVFIVDELPRNSLGKVLKGQLREKVSGLIDAESIPETEKVEPALPTH